MFAYSFFLWITKLIVLRYFYCLQTLQCRFFYYTKLTPFLILCIVIILFARQFLFLKSYSGNMAYNTFDGARIYLMWLRVCCVRHQCWVISWNIYGFLFDDVAFMRQRSVDIEFIAFKWILFKILPIYLVVYGHIFTSLGALLFQLKAYRSVDIIIETSHTRRIAYLCGFSRYKNNLIEWCETC